MKKLMNVLLVIVGSLYLIGCGVFETNKMSGEFSRGSSEDMILSHHIIPPEKKDKFMVGGKVFRVKLVLDRPAKEVWPILKDFNLWQGWKDGKRYGFYYDAIVGDSEGKKIQMGAKPDGSANYMPINVRRVVPEHLIIAEGMPITYGTMTIGSENVFTLTEEDGKTIFNGLLIKHNWSTTMTADEMYDADRKIADGSEKTWGENFLPRLKALVENSK